MTYKLKVTIFAVTLCLFGLTLITVSPVFAEDSAEFIDCQKIKIKKQMRMAREKIHCFRDLVRKLEASTGNIVAVGGTNDASSQGEGIEGERWCKQYEATTSIAEAMQNCMEESHIDDQCETIQFNNVTKAYVLCSWTNDWTPPSSRR